ncbi:MAG TPA: hypothetical protein VG778_05080 [Blastocatellia bacterium]|nr:hypothetical protein [Blastocatellia bacterium]
MAHGARFCPRCGVATALGPPSAVDISNAPYQQPQPPYPPPSNPGYFPNQAPPHPGYYQAPPVPQPGFAQPYQAQPGAYPVYYQAPKDKTVALLLAIFLGGWTWVYTYRKDAWKFWLSLGLNLTVFNPIWTVFILLIPNIGLWIWSIVDVAAKPDEFYRNYSSQ